ncbi:hypothetical protein [Pseudoalteromonas rhizosphaerae]
MPSAGLFALCADDQ